MRRDFDFKEMKARIPVELVVIAIGGEVFDPGPAGKQKARCPFHGEDRHPSAFIAADGMSFACSACGLHGDIFDLVQYAGLAHNLMEAIDWLEENTMPGGSTTGSS